MSNQSLQPTRASYVYPTDSDVNIPYPNIVITGITSGVGSSSLVDTNVDFLELGIKVGDTVFDDQNFSWGTVTSVSQHELGMSDTSFDAGSISYRIYQGENTGCTLYVGTGGGMLVLTADNNVVELVGVQDGTFIPIKVLRVFASSTDCTDIIALW